MLTASLAPRGLYEAGGASAPALSCSKGLRDAQIWEVSRQCGSLLLRHQAPLCTAVTPEPCVQADNPGNQLSAALDARDEAIVPNLMMLKEGNLMQPVRKPE